MNTHPLLHGLGQLPKVVQNAFIPLDQQLRAEQDAAVSSNVHSVMQKRKFTTLLTTIAISATPS